MEGVHLKSAAENGVEDTDDKKDKKNRQVAPNANNLHGERIGHVLVTAESSNQSNSRRLERGGHLAIFENSVEKHQPAQPEASNTKKIDSMSHAELLAYSENITVEGTTLRKIFETHLIGEKGLRRLIAEHLRGGDLKIALQKEIVEREIDFERDPAMRDLAVTLEENAEQLHTTEPSELDKLLEKASLKIPAAELNEEMAFYKARANYEASQLAKHRQQRRVIDIALAAVISLLVIIILTLYLTLS